jgi:hypothetical protein
VLTILCLNCKQNQNDNKIVIDESDKIAVCPHCKATYFVDSGQGKVTSKIEKNRIRYLIELNNQLYQFLSSKKLGIKSGSQLTVVNIHGKMIALADHDRQLWLPVKPEQHWKKLFKYLRLTVIGLLLLQTVVWSKEMIALFQENHFQAIAIIVILGLLFLISALIVYLQSRKQSTIPENLRIEFNDYNQQ